MNLPFPGMALRLGPRLQRGWVPLLLTLCLVVQIAGAWKYPPWGGAAALLLLAVLAGAFWLLLCRPGRFLAVLLVYGVLAPFLSRLTHLPLGWFKGAFFFLGLPLWILSRSAAGGNDVWKRTIQVPLLCYLAAAVVLSALGVVSLFRGIDPIKVFEGLKGYLLYPPLLFLAAEASGSMEKARRFLWLILALSGLTALGAALQAWVGIDLLTRTGLNLETGGLAFISFDPITGKVFQRVFSILDDQSALAAFSLVGIALSLFLVQTCRSRRRQAAILAILGLNAYALLLTYNITVLAGAVLALIILMVRSRNPRLLGIFFLVTAVVLALAWIRFGEFISHRLLTSFSLKEGISTSLLDRVQANRKALTMLAAQPVIGSGLGSTANELVAYRMGLKSSYVGGFATDNYYMTTALEVGGIGLAAVILLHLLPLWGLLRLERWGDRQEKAFARIAGATVIAFLAMNLSNGHLNTNPTNLLYWALAGLAWRAAEDRRLGARAGGSPPS